MSDNLSLMQENYWNDLSKPYQRIMKISVADFHYGPQIPGEKDLKLLPELNEGMTALELGCGGGQNSIYLAKKGLKCSALDISSSQIAHGRRYSAKENVDVNYKTAPMDEFKMVFKDEKFDLIHSSHAFEFVENPSKIIKDCATALKNGGHLLISTVHPLYNGEWVENIDEDGNVDGMGLFLTNYFSPPDDERIKNGKVEVISRAYPVSMWFKWFREARLEVVALEEPAELSTGDEPPYTNEDWANNEGELKAIPGTLIIMGRK